MSDAGVIPKSPSVDRGNDRSLNPEDYDPELANIAIARLLIEKLGRPSKISKEFNKYKAIWKALNHVPPTFDEKGVMIDPGNPTGLDCSLRLALYEQWEAGSINEEGQYFDKIWQFLMKPKLVMSSMLMPGQYGKEEQKPSILDRLLGRKKGVEKNESQ